MLPPAPGLFSITTDWPQTSCRRLPTSRAVISVEPPGVNGTTIRTGFDRPVRSRGARREDGGRGDGSRGETDETTAIQLGASLGDDRPIVRVVGLAGVWRRIAGKSMRADAAAPDRSRPYSASSSSFAAGNDVGAGQPAVQIDVAAARGTERQLGFAAGLPQTGQAFGLARRGRIFGRLNWHSTSRSGSENLRRRAA